MLADIIAYEMDYGSSGEPGIPDYDPADLESIGFDESSIENIKTKSGEEVPKAFDMFL